MTDESETLRQAREAAHTYTRATQQMAAFLDHTSAEPSPDQEAEYAALLEREQLTYRARQDALHAFGLVVRSIEPADPAAE